MGYAHGIRWTDELIKEKVLEVKEALELDRMPTRSECESYFHNGALTGAIDKRTRWHILAQELDLPLKDCETFFGKRYEVIAQEALCGRGCEVRRMPQNFPYDLLVNDCVKVDVKASHLYRGKLGNFYTFNLEKPFSTCDVYILFALTDDNEIKDVYIVPSKFVATNTQISVGEKQSKYSRFAGRWDYINSLCSLWDEVI